MIRLEHMSKTFVKDTQEIPAVKNVSLSVPKGEIHGVIGHSGAGKSTLIRCVNLLESPTSGHVYINDDDITQVSGAALSKKRKHIGMIFQHFNLLKTATVYDNVALPLKLIGVAKSEIATRVQKYLSIVELQEKTTAYPNQLSGGEKQRVAIARALAQEPEILLSDEATSALDPETTNAILDLLLKINETLGITILLITHEMHVIQKISDYVYVMEGGSVIEEGSTIQLFTKPQHPTTRRFLQTVSDRQFSADMMQELSKNGAVWQLTFVGGATGEPLLSKVTRECAVVPNILAANIMELKNGTVGHLMIHVTGDSSSLNQAKQFLIEQDVYVDEWEGA